MISESTVTGFAIFASTDKVDTSRQAIYLKNIDFLGEKTIYNPENERQGHERGAERSVFCQGSLVRIINPRGPLKVK